MCTFHKNRLLRWKKKEESRLLSRFCGQIGVLYFSVLLNCQRPISRPQPRALRPPSPALSPPSPALRPPPRAVGAVACPARGSASTFPRRPVPPPAACASPGVLWLPRRLVLPPTSCASPSGGSSPSAHTGGDEGECHLHAPAAVLLSPSPVSFAVTEGLSFPLSLRPVGATFGRPPLTRVRNPRRHVGIAPYACCLSPVDPRRPTPRLFTSAPASFARPTLPANRKSESASSTDSPFDF